MDNKVKFCVPYRPPSLPGNQILVKLEHIFSNHPDNHVLVGDININMLNFNCNLASKYKHLLTLNGFHLANKVNLDNAAGVINNTISLIDHVICSNRFIDRCNGHRFYGS